MEYKDKYINRTINVAYKEDVKTGELIPYKDDMSSTVMQFIREHFNQKDAKRVIEGIAYDNSLVNDEEFAQ